MSVLPILPTQLSLILWAWKLTSRFQGSAVIDVSSYYSVTHLFNAYDAVVVVRLSFWVIAKCRLIQLTRISTIKVPTLPWPDVALLFDRSTFGLVQQHRMTHSFSAPQIVLPSMSHSYFIYLRYIFRYIF